MVSPKMLAEHILWLRGQQGHTTTPRGLIKLVYLCHAWHLGLHGRGLVNEPVVTGKFGPIFRSLDDQFAIFGNEQISGVRVRDHSGSIHDANLVQTVNKVYGKEPDDVLSALTHLPGTPWVTVHGEHGEDAEIPDALIKKHYDEEIAKTKGEGR